MEGDFKDGNMIHKKALKLKKKLASGGLSPGIWMALPCPTACEIMAGVGFDWVVVDAEHSTFNPETLLHILMAFNASDTVPIIRIPSNDDVTIKHALDMGWGGVLVPLIESADDVRRVVSACRYPPLGIRGFGPRRAGNYYQNQEEYATCANDAIICAIQIENISAAEDIDEIVKVPGLDWILLGPNDLSGTMGCFRDFEDTLLWETMRKILDTAHAAGIPTGNPLGNADDIEKTLALGCKLVNLGEDMSYLKDSADHAIDIFNNIIDNRKSRNHETKK